MSSPCIKVCQMDPVRGVCIGCCRTLDEIARWGSMPGAQRDALEHEGESADLKNLAHHWLEFRNDHIAAPRFRLLRSEHEAAQPGAADVLDSCQIEHDALARCGLRRDQGFERLAKLVAGGVIDPPDRRQHDDIAKPRIADFHAAVPVRLTHVRPQTELAALRS